MGWGGDGLSVLRADRKRDAVKTVGFDAFFGVVVWSLRASLP